ncbi:MULTISPECIES: tetratricopeptide repeat protein [unclassified Sphingopyxis]|uniref:tetratricopeptide repeat protein n=2 Tax=Sphingopyxis TaxID=165697 RepID=UPI0007304FF1|nr:MULTISPECIES: tetratricopeptide repeat protein [unclassified Sphingopyxis]KTE67073.1 hypothetical protein ATE65_03290 [Sphingopyxis sp. H100]
MALLPTFRLAMRMLPLALWLAVASGCADSAQRAAENAAIAESQLAAGDVEAARKSIREAIAERDDVADYYILLGRIELRAQQLTSAFNAYSMALDLQADNPEILQAIAELGLQTGRVREANDAADRLLLLMPGATQAMLVKGFIAIDDGRPADARKMASDILALNARDEGGIILLARLDALDGKTDVALKAVDEAIASGSTTPALNVTRLEIYRLQGDGKRMKAILPDILKTMDYNEDFVLDYANLLYKTGEIAAARSEIVKAMGRSPNDRELLARLVQLWREYDRRPLSDAQLQYISGSGTRAQQIILARFYLDAGESDKAKRLISRLFDEHVLEGQALMARILLAQGDKKNAYELASRVLAADARNEDALLVRAARSLWERNLDRAIEDANVVVSDSPENYLGYVELARAYIAKGQDIRARQTFERGMDFLPQSLELADAYRAFLLRVGDRQRAVTLDQDVAIAKPSSVRAWAVYSRTCSQYGDALCAAKAEAGLARARVSFLVDDPPGTPRRRGLFARISPEKICATSGGVCTGS